MRDNNAFPANFALTEATFQVRLEKVVIVSMFLLGSFMKKISVLSLALTGVLAILTSSASASPSVCGSTPGNLVNNCGFESGSFSGWSVTGNLQGGIGGFYVGVDGVNPNSGNYEGYFGAQSQFGQTGSGNKSGPVTTLSQDLTSTLNYHLYQISFYLDNNGCSVSDPGCPGYYNHFDVSFAGDTGLNQNNVANSGGVYDHYVFVAPSVNYTPLLQFDFTNDSDVFYLDDVTVTDLGPGGPTPEPASLLLVAPALAGLLFVLRRRRAA